MIIHYLFLLSAFLISLASSQSLSLLTPNSSSVSNDITEWTAMGDSYATGIGAGTAPQEPDPYRCFRFSNAYPNLMQSGPGSLQPSPDKFNFVACSGAKLPEIIDQQFLDHGRPGRPAWGAPEFVTITMGGNDVGILYLVLTCIYSVRIIVIDCDAVIQRGFDILDSDDFKSKLNDVIGVVGIEGRRLYGPNFHIFVTGYAQLFNSDTEQCDHVTFKPDSLLLTPQYLTRARRIRMNELAIALNGALETAVGRFPPSDVTFVDYDALFEGHRFCDRPEPNANDDETWFFALGTTSDPTDQANGYIEVAGTNATGKNVARSLRRKTHPRANQILDGQNDGTPRHLPVKEPRDDTIPGNVTGGLNAMFADYFRVFHPKSRGHQAIRSAVLEAIDRVRLSRGPVSTAASYDTA